MNDQQINEILIKNQVYKFPQLLPISAKKNKLHYTLNTLALDTTKEFIININDKELDCLFQYNTGESKNKLLIMLNGGRSYLTNKINSEIYYKYSRTAWCSDFDFMQLNICDATWKLVENKDIICFYWGIIEETQLLIHKVLELLGLTAKDLIFWSGSAGATASILLSQYFEGCTVIAFNSQLDYNSKSWSKKLNSISDQLNLDFYQTNCNITKIILTNTLNTYVLAENIAAQNDLNKIKLLADKLGIKLKYGIQVSNNIGIWLYNRPAKDLSDSKKAQEIAHINQDTLLSAKAVYQFGKIVKENKEITPELAELFKIITEYWDRE